MKVAVVTESFLPSINGVTNSVLRVLETLFEKGHQAMIVAPTKEGSTYAGFPIVTCPFVPLGGFPVAIPTPAITAALDRFAPDVIHAAAPFWLGSQAIAYAARKRTASVAVYQTNVSGYMERYGLEFATGLLEAATAAIHKPATLSLAPTAEAQRYLNSLGIESVYVWGRGVDLETYRPDRKAGLESLKLRSLWAPQGEQIIGYVGRLAPEKQVGRLIELSEIPGVRIVIVGDGPDRHELEARFRGTGTIFTGALTGEELANSYGAMDLFVHCGTEETFGQTIQEAHASGLPVIAPNAGGPRHLISEGRNGFLVDSSRQGAFREKVELLLTNPHLLASFSHEARAAVEGKSWAKNNQELLAHYDAALKLVGLRGAVAA
jgi:phosphatidylinositol alpha 1,6-mannosyltransferase